MIKEKPMKCLMCDKQGDIRKSPESGTIVRLSLCENHWAEYVKLFIKEDEDEVFTSV